MKNKLFIVMAAVVGVFIVARPLLSHHSFSLYDNEKTITLKGTAAEFNWVNPHVSIVVEVKDEKGNVEKWIVECPPPNTMHRAGWSGSSIKAGDAITVTGNPYKDGRKVMNPKKIILANGESPGLREE